jgi:glycine betaine/choline ABC-type transport system substrate-binding protein
MDRTKACGLILAGIALLGMTACGGRKKNIVVGSKNFTEQVVLGEIIAQHLENRLQQKVERKLNLGGTLITYEALHAGEISLYPEYLGTIHAEILKEPLNTDPSVLFERARLELKRQTQAELLDPLGIDNGFALVIRSSDAKEFKLENLSQAAGVKRGWRLGEGYEFQTRPDGQPLLAKYALPFIAPPRAMDLGLLYKALSDGQVTMIAANATDGALTSADFTVLADDKKVFPPYSASILVREEALAAEPRLRAALSELSGKLDNGKMRQLNAQVDIAHRQPAEVASGFLAQSGLK